MESDPSDTEHRTAIPLGQDDDKARMVMQLQWLQTIALGYLIVFSSGHTIGVAPGLIVVMAFVANLMLLRLPPAAFQTQLFDVLLILWDVMLASAAVLASGTDVHDFFFLFFFVVLIAALGESMLMITGAAAGVAAAFVFFQYEEVFSSPALLLRVPFCFATALTFSFFTGSVRRERARALAAEVVSKAKGDFLGMMSHEMRSPLHVVLAQCAVLREDESDPLSPRQRQAIGRIEAHAHELSELINRTLWAARLESGTIPVRIEEFSLADVLEEVHLAVEPHVRPGHRVRLHLPPHPPTFRSDRLKLKEVLVNLITNALKYAPGGTVDVRVQQPAPDGLTEIHVRDDGPGIHPHIQANVFDLFTRAPEADAKGVEGVGLGLYIVRRLVDLLGGAVDLQSEPGRGATFIVRVPVRLSEMGSSA